MKRLARIEETRARHLDSETTGKKIIEIKGRVFDTEKNLLLCDIRYNAISELIGFGCGPVWKQIAEKSSNRQLPLLRCVL